MTITPFALLPSTPTWTLRPVSSPSTTQVSISMMISRDQVVLLSVNAHLLKAFQTGAQSHSIDQSYKPTTKSPTPTTRTTPSSTTATLDRTSSTSTSSQDPQSSKELSEMKPSPRPRSLPQATTSTTGTMSYKMTDVSIQSTRLLSSPEIPPNSEFFLQYLSP